MSKGSASASHRFKQLCRAKKTATTMKQNLEAQNIVLRLNNAFRALFVFCLDVKEGSNRSIISYALVAQCFINHESFGASVFVLESTVCSIKKILFKWFYQWNNISFWYCVKKPTAINLKALFCRSNLWFDVTWNKNFLRT